MEHLYPYILSIAITAIIVIAISGFIGKIILKGLVTNYLDKLIKEGIMTEKKCEENRDKCNKETEEYRKEVTSNLTVIKTVVLAIAVKSGVPWEQYKDLVK